MKAGMNPAPRGLEVDGTMLVSVKAEPNEGAIHVAVGGDTAIMTVASARFLVEAVNLAVGELSEALEQQYDCMPVVQRVTKGALNAHDAALADDAIATALAEHAGGAAHEASLSNKSPGTRKALLDGNWTSPDPEHTPESKGSHKKGSHK